MRKTKPGADSDMTNWSALKHAYGNAADVPALLAQLSPDPKAGVWDELWSRLCHQGTVYSGSFAALPALAHAAEQWNPAERVQTIALAASILASEDVHGHRDDFLRPVAWVVPRFKQLCYESLAQTPLPKHEFIYLLQAASSFEGDRFWGQHLDHLVSGEFPGVCPNCRQDLYLVIGEYGFFATAEEWVERTGSTAGEIVVRPGIKRFPIERNAGPLPEIGRWLYEHAHTADQEDVAEWLTYVFGTSACPSCRHKFEVQEAIARAFRFER